MKTFRKYGKTPFNTVVVHGGPGAAGEMKPVAVELSTAAGIIEPFQTANTITGQVHELKGVIEKNADQPITLVGFSWGAMLGFIFASRYQQMVKKLILIGCTPFEDKYAANILQTRLNRLSEADRAEVLSLIKSLGKPALTDKDSLMSRFGDLMAKADSCNAAACEHIEGDCRYDIYDKVWREASELRNSGKLLEMGKLIACPVIAIHGDYDPHPAEGVRKPLGDIVKDFRFVLLENCGHRPWIEKEVKEHFFNLLRTEIS